MSVTLNKIPALNQSVNNPIILDLLSSNATQTGFKYLVKLYIETSNNVFNIVFQSRINPRPSVGNLLIDLSPILKDYIISSIHITGYLNLNGFGKDIIKYKIETYDDYSTTPTLIDARYGYAFNGVFDTFSEQIQTGSLNTLYYPSKYDATSSIHSLSTTNRTKSVELDDCEQLSFFSIPLQGDSTSSIDTTTGSVIVDMVVTKYVTGSSSQLIITGSNATTVVTTGQIIQHWGVGPANINAVSANYINDEVDYYYLRFRDGNGKIKNYTTNYRYDVVDRSCLNRDKKYRVFYISKMGGILSHSFRWNNYETIDIDRKVFDKYLPYTHTQQDTGLTQFKIKQSQKILLQTEWIEQQEVKELEEIFTSPKVMLYYFNDDLNDYVTVPVIPLVETYTKKTNINDKMLQMKIEFQFANNNRSQL